MINLEKTSGLPIEVDEQNNLKLNSPAIATGPSFVRKFEEMVPVLIDSDVKVPAKIMYNVTRGVCLSEHEKFA
jgi:hypothetical protein